MSGFLSGAEGMNNIMNQWAQANAAQQYQDTQTDADANAQLTAAAIPTSDTGTLSATTPTMSDSSNPDGTQPAPVAPVTSTQLATPTTVTPLSQGGSGVPDGEWNDPYKSGQEKIDKSDDFATKYGDDKKPSDSKLGSAVKTVAQALETNAGPGSDASTVNPSIAPTPNPQAAPPPATPAAPGAIPAGMPTAPPLPANTAPGAAAGMAPWTQGQMQAQAQAGALNTANPSSPGPAARPMIGAPAPNASPYGAQPGGPTLAPTVGGTPRLLNQPDPNLAGGGQGGAQPAQSAPAVDTDTPPKPSLGSTFLAAAGIGTANAEESPNKGPVPGARYVDPVTGQPTGPAQAPSSGKNAAPAQPAAPAGTNPQAASLPMAKTDDGDAGKAPQAPIKTDVPSGGPTATTAPSAKVAPDQKGPTDTTSPPVPSAEKIKIPPYDPTPYAGLIEHAQTRPDSAMALAALEKAARETGVPASQIALLWNKESKMADSAPTGTHGEIGPMQILPGTAKEVDPKGQYDLNKLGDSFKVAGLLLNRYNSKYGQGSPGTIVAWNGGEGTADKYVAGVDPSTDKALSNAVAYMKSCYPGQNPGPTNCTPAPQIDHSELVQATQQGPDATLSYVAQTAPNNVALGQKWQATANALTYAALRRGDYQGAQAAQDFVLQQSRQGANQALMNADRALAAGDATTAAQQLAVAHAFFPDGSFGRFGTDSQGRVWAQQFSENDPTMALGKPFQVTRQNLQPQLIMTQDPNKYMATVQQINKQNADIEFEKQHGAYFGSLIKTKDDMIAERAEAARMAHEAAMARIAEAQSASQRSTDERATAAGEQANARIIAAGEQKNSQAQAEQKRQDAQNATYDKEAETFFGPEAVNGSGKMPPDPEIHNMTPQQRSMGALAYSYIRRNHSGTDPMPSATAREMAIGLANGSGAYKIDRNTGAVTRSTDPGTPVAYLPKSAVARLLGTARPPPVARNPNPALSTGRLMPSASAYPISDPNSINYTPAG